MLTLLALLRAGPARATHLRAGAIQANVDTTAAHNPNRILFTLPLYHDTSPGPARQDSAMLFFGDGTRSRRVAKASETPIGFGTSVIIFYFDHIYPGSGSYAAAGARAKNQLYKRGAAARSTRRGCYFCR